MARSVGGRLIVAARNGDLAQVTALLEAGAPVDATTGEGLTALHLAAAYDCHDVVELLLSSGAKLEARDAHGSTPLYLAARHGYSSMVRQLLAAGANANAANAGGFTSLIAATEIAEVGVAELLIGAGADVNALEHNERVSALMWASHRGRTDLVRFLISAKADPEQRSIDADRLLESILGSPEGRFVVPEVFFGEIASSLSKRLEDRSDLAVGLASVSSIPFRRVPWEATPHRVVADLVLQRVGAYDAVYVAIALRQSTQAFGFTHWNRADWINVGGAPSMFPASVGPDVAIFQASQSR
jgi:hypothetical protein